MTDNTELKQAGRAATNSYGDGYQVALIAEDLVDALEEAEAERDAAVAALEAMRARDESPTKPHERESARQAARFKRLTITGHSPRRDPDAEFTAGFNAGWDLFA